MSPPRRAGRATPAGGASCGGRLARTALLRFVPAVGPHERRARVRPRAVVRAASSPVCFGSLAWEAPSKATGIDSPIPTRVAMERGRRGQPRPSAQRAARQAAAGPVQPAVPGPAQPGSDPPRRRRGAPALSERRRRGRHRRGSEWAPVPARVARPPKRRGAGSARPRLESLLCEDSERRQSGRPALACNAHTRSCGGRG